MLVAPHLDLPHPVTVTGWGVQAHYDSVDDAELARFVEKYESGPQAPEPGGPCEGGVGTPVELS